MVCNLVCGYLGTVFPRLPEKSVRFIPIGTVYQQTSVDSCSHWINIDYWFTTEVQNCNRLPKIIFIPKWKTWLIWKIMNAKTTVKNFHMHMYVCLSLFVNIRNNRFPLWDAILLFKPTQQPHEVGMLVLTVQVRNYREAETQRSHIFPKVT